MYIKYMDSKSTSSSTSHPLPPTTILYDVVIIGGGPGAVAAGVYCARKKLKTVLITDSFGGQSVVSDDIHNWIGDKKITGVELAQRLEDHIRDYTQEVNIKFGQKVTGVTAISCSTPDRICDFEIKTDKGEVFHSKSVIICSGARRRKMGITGEDKFGNKGVAYCSTCDAPLFKDKKVVVIGGGNAGLEAAHDLFQYASEVTILDFNEALKADAVTIDEVKKNPKLKNIILNAQVTEVIGDQFVTGLKYKDRSTGQENTIEVGGIFVEIGSVPNSEMVKNLVQINPHGEIMINFQHARTSHPGVFAAGDVTDDPYKQNNISVGDGVRAALAAYAYLQNREKVSPASHQP